MTVKFFLPENGKKSKIGTKKITIIIDFWEFSLFSESKILCTSKLNQKTQSIQETR